MYWRAEKIFYSIDAEMFRAKTFKFKVNLRYKFFDLFYFVSECFWLGRVYNLISCSKPYCWEKFRKNIKSNIKGKERFRKNIKSNIKDLATIAYEINVLWLAGFKDRKHHEWLIHQKESQFSYSKTVCIRKHFVFKGLELIKKDIVTIALK